MGHLHGVSTSLTEDVLSQHAKLPQPLCTLDGTVKARRSLGTMSGLTRHKVPAMGNTRATGKYSVCKDMSRTCMKEWRLRMYIHSCLRRELSVLSS